MAHSAALLRTAVARRFSALQAEFVPQPQPDAARAASRCTYAAQRGHSAGRCKQRRAGRTPAPPAVAAAAGTPLPSGPSGPTNGTIPASGSAPGSSDASGEADLRLDLDLDYTPALSPVREVLCLLLPTLVALVLYTASGRWHGHSWLAKLVVTLAAAAAASVLRTSWLEGLYKARERAYAALGDPDSRFRPISVAPSARGLVRSGARGGAAHQGLKSLGVHVKVKLGDLDIQRAGHASVSGGDEEQPASRGSSSSGGAGDGPPTMTALHLYHGFGANLGSYKRIHEALAVALRGVVTAHDAPGFGLTQRPPDVASYYLTFNGRLGRLVLDYELSQLGLVPRQAGGQQQNQQQQQQQHEHARQSQLGTAGGSAACINADATAAVVPSGGIGQPAAAPHRASGGSSLAANAGGGAGAVQLPGGLGGSVTLTLSGTEDAADGDSIPGAEEPLGAAARTSNATSALASQAAGPISGYGTVKRILLGHSLGGACAALEAVGDPEGLAALILVAPAIFAFPGPEYARVSLSPDRTMEHAAASAAAAAPSHGAARAHRGSGVTPELGEEPPGSHVTDPPMVRRLYPVGHVTRAPGGAGATGEQDQQQQQHWSFARRLLRSLGRLLAAVASLAMFVLLRAVSPIITLLLRSLVRRRTFWLKGLQSAYYDPAGVTPDIVDAYRMPQLVAGWESGMVNFLLARLARPGSVELEELLRLQAAPALAATDPDAATNAAAAGIAAGASAADVGAAALPRPQGGPGAAQQPGGSGNDDNADGSGDDADLASRLAALVAATRLPVLIIHGLYDRLVPASNSQRLARTLIGCELVLLDRCGHMPHEEMPEAFIELVADFARRVPAR